MNTIFFSQNSWDFQKNPWKITISTWPVIISKNNKKILLHKSESTGKFQFIGGRYHDTISFQENAIERAKEVLPTNSIILEDISPIIIFDSIIRNEDQEKILLVHYKAKIEDEENIWEAKWFTIEEIEELAINNKISSPNVILCSKHFLEL